VSTSREAGQRLRKMMRQQQVDTLEFCYDNVGKTFEAARTACERCDTTDECVDFLGSRVSLRIPGFCPNRLRFERFRAT
jgi:hypothetical protein